MNTSQFHPKQKVSERGKAWTKPLYRHSDSPSWWRRKLRISWKPSSLSTPREEQLWDQWFEERKVRLKLIKINNYQFPWGQFTLSYPFSVFFLSCDHQWLLTLSWWHHATRFQCLPTTLNWHKTSNLGCHLPQIRDRQGSRQAKGLLPGSSCSLVSGEILADESHSLLCTVIFYTDHAQTREQKRCVCSSSIRNTKTLFWWIICLLRKAQLNCRSSNCCEVLQMIQTDKAKSPTFKYHRPYFYHHREVTLLCLCNYLTFPCKIINMKRQGFPLD